MEKEQTRELAFLLVPIVSKLIPEDTGLSYIDRAAIISGIAARWASDAIETKESYFIFNAFNEGETTP